ncbi:AAA family ATPase [Streptomyces sp. NPDC101118]|uniref:AAA family ATPase n=1 Tax=Streptomyces sp. NPDC101118 TaxID=3366109 RepID=UPI0037F5064B
MADSRRIVTAVFIDLVGSTVLAETLDPEALRRTMDRYYTACTTAVTERGGVVEKFIGDAVMAVFGAFVSHEDDALHAVQAAYAVREAVAGLAGGAARLDIHCGIASGEAVVAGALGGAARVVGDVVHTAARLQSHAQAHEILIGDETARLVGNGVRLESVAPLSLKGKRDPVTAWRVLGLLDGTSQQDLVPLVGRDAELGVLRADFRAVRRERHSRLVNVTGPAGIGKSRLVREFLTAGPGPLAAGPGPPADPRADPDPGPRPADAVETVVLRGTCQPYGAGLAYRPLAEAVRSLPGGWEQAAAALAALRPSADRAVAALAVALGVRTENGLPVSVDEIGWAFRRLLEALGRRAPTVLVLEDCQWAGPTLLDTIAELADGVRDTELLIVCATRGEPGPAGSGADAARGASPAEPARSVGAVAAGPAGSGTGVDLNGSPAGAGPAGGVVGDGPAASRTGVDPDGPRAGEGPAGSRRDAVPDGSRAGVGMEGSVAGEGPAGSRTDAVPDGSRGGVGLEGRGAGEDQAGSRTGEDPSGTLTGAGPAASSTEVGPAGSRTGAGPDGSRTGADPAASRRGAYRVGAHADADPAAGRAGVETTGSGPAPSPAGTPDRPPSPVPPAAGPRTLRLEPLRRADTERLVGLLADRTEVAAQDGACTDEALARVVRECDGNPLFAELLLENLAGHRPVARGVPTTIRVLLTAWLDRLPATDRAVLERAAGVGGAFTAEDVRALAADAPALTGEAVDDALARLLTSRVVHPYGPPGAYRFTRMLARDTLYEMTSKARRAAWHTVLADRLEAPPPGAPAPGPDAEGDLAHHLESACRLLSEADPGDPRLPALTGRAARALVATGYRALHRRDLPAAVSLMERGRALTPDGDPQHRILAVRITDAYASLARWDSAREAVAEAERRSVRDVPTRDTCAVLRQLVALRSGGPADAHPPGPAPAPDDDLSWCRLHQLSSLRSFAEGRIGAAESAMRDALARARGLGDAYEENRILVSICELTQWSPTPLTRAVALCEELARRFDGDRGLLVPILLTRARHLALSGRVERARADVALARRHSADLGLTLGGIAADQTAGLVESLAGAHPEAAGHYDAAAAGLGALGQTTTAGTLRLYAARERFRAGEGADAAVLAEPDGGRPPETRAQAVRLALLARVRAAAGDAGGAVGAVDRALATLDRTDDPCLTGDVWFEAARALDDAGHPVRARAAAARALAVLTEKEAVLPAGTVRAWLAEREEHR